MELPASPKTDCHPDTKQSGAIQGAFQLSYRFFAANPIESALLMHGGQEF